MVGEEDNTQGANIAADVAQSGIRMPGMYCRINKYYLTAIHAVVQSIQLVQ